MILADDVAVAIEAKFTEPRYESVQTWLAAARTTNRGEVLEGWIRAIEGATEGAVDREVVRGLPYQLIHRTASVCCVSRRKRVVVYQVFGDSPGPDYTEDLRRLASAIPDRGGVSFYVLARAFTQRPRMRNSPRGGMPGARHGRGCAGRPPRGPAARFC